MQWLTRRRLPRNAGRIAATHALLLDGMLDARELFAAIKPAALLSDAEQPLLRAVDDITREVLAKQQPSVWEALPPLAQDLMVKRAQWAAPDVVRDLVDGLRDNPENVLDVHMLVLHRLSDCARLERVVRVVSRHRRQADLAAAYGEVVAEEVLPPAAVVDALLTGPRSDRTLALVTQIIDALVEEQVRGLRTVLRRMDDLSSVKLAAARRVLATFPDIARRREEYFTDSMAVRAQVTEHVRDLSPAELDRLRRGW